MKKEVNPGTHNRLNGWIYSFARYAEVALSIIILVVIVVVGIRLVMSVTDVSFSDMDMDFFTEFLAHALALVVGVEFVRMLCRHSAQTVVDVLLFATARQMVVEHLNTLETLIGVVAIAVLFAVRKYLLTDKGDSEIPAQKTDDK